MFSNPSQQGCGDVTQDGTGGLSGQTIPKAPTTCPDALLPRAPVRTHSENKGGDPFCFR